MTPAHVRQCGIPLSGIGKPVKGFPVFGQQVAKRIVPGQAHADAMALFAVLRGSGQIMWIAEHEAGLKIRAGVDFRCLLRPNSC